MSRRATLPAKSKKQKKPYLRIATEEAWATREMFDLYRKILKDNSFDDPGFRSLWGFFLQSNIGFTNTVVDRLLDMGERRIADMDGFGIDKQVLMLTAPGVQVFEKSLANAIARNSNDELDEACRKYPDRFVPMAAIAPQDPKTAAKELERCVTKLGFHGAVVNSHWDGEYLDDRKYWDIFAAAEALDVPIYIHPQTPPRDTIGPMLSRHVDGAIFGFGVEVAFHTLAIILAGAFDRFPKLKIVIGHAGEALPFWLFRLDHMQQAVIANTKGAKPTKRKVSEYMKENVWITTSGMAWTPAIRFCQDVLGMDRVLYAMDYPYQAEKSEVRTSDRLPISDRAKKKFFQTNAEKVFKL
jgi:5-carboxyvanillate decarboxylase